MKPIIISISPNTEKDDVLLSLKTLFSFSKWKNLSSINLAKEKLSSFFPEHGITLVNSGRIAMSQVLKSLDIKKDDEIIIQAFTCVSVPSSIQWTGAKPVFADIQQDTYNLDPADIRKKITFKTKAIIVQHTFGIPASIIEIKRIAEENNLILIEDCAHALGARFNNQLLGTFGDVAILSFGRDKAISSVFGGAIVSKDRELINKINDLEKKKELPPNWWVVQQLLHPIIMKLVTSLYFIAGLGKVILVISQKLRLLSKAVAPEERIGNKPNFFSWQYSPALANLLILQLSKLEKFTKKRRQIASKYKQKLLPSLEYLNGASYLRFPLQVKNKTEILTKAKKHNIILGDWYSTPVTPCSIESTSSGYITGSCPVAELVSRQVINLPTHPRMSDQDVQRVINLIQSSL